MLITDMPQDMIFEIVKRLDTKSIARLMQTNKAFRDLIQAEMNRVRVKMENGEEKELYNISQFVIGEICYKLSSDHLSDVHIKSLKNKYLYNPKFGINFTLPENVWCQHILSEISKVRNYDKIPPNLDSLIYYSYYTNFEIIYELLEQNVLDESEKEALKTINVLNINITSIRPWTHIIACQHMIDAINNDDKNKVKALLDKGVVFPRSKIKFVKNSEIRVLLEEQDAKNQPLEQYIFNLSRDIALNSAEVEQYLKAGAKINHMIIRTTNRTLPFIHEAALRGDVELIKLMLKYGADVNMVSPGGNALHYAFRNFYYEVTNNQEIVQELLEAGAEINIQDAKGDTALINACRYNEIDLIVIETLIKYGADVNASNYSNETALDFANYYGNSEVSRVLLAAGADKTKTKKRNMGSKSLNDETYSHPEDLGLDKIMPEFRVSKLKVGLASLLVACCVMSVFILSSLIPFGIAIGIIVAEFVSVNVILNSVFNKINERNYKKLLYERAKSNFKISKENIFGVDDYIVTFSWVQELDKENTLKNVQSVEIK